ncbi:unnamed protein product, partial [Aphanomyces euteiches]
MEDMKAFAVDAPSQAEETRQATMESIRNKLSSWSKSLDDLETRASDYGGLFQSQVGGFVSTQRQQIADALHEIEENAERKKKQQQVISEEAKKKESEVMDAVKDNVKDMLSNATDSAKSSFNTLKEQYDKYDD